MNLNVKISAHKYATHNWLDIGLGIEKCSTCKMYCKEFTLDILSIGDYNCNEYTLKNIIE